MLKYEDWLPQSQALSEGSKERVGHWCGEGDVLVIEHSSEGYRAYCHRCHESGFKPHGRQSLNVQLKRWNEADAKLQTEAHKAIRLPDDLGTDFPSEAVLWLSRGGITGHLRDKYRIRYSNYYKRVFIPVYSGSTLVYWQARAVHKGQQPKYINPAVDKGAIRFSSLNTIRPEVVCVTEDILSAIKVGEVPGIEGCSILGTTASVQDINYINSFKEIILWFDPDEAGRRATRNIKRQLELQGRSPICITSTKDPKEYGRAELEEIICHHLT